jgi:hypothetical protein
MEMNVRPLVLDTFCRMVGLTFLVLFTSCSAFKPLPTRTSTSNPSASSYLTNIEPEASDGNVAQTVQATAAWPNAGFDIEKAVGPQFRFAILMDVEVESLLNHAGSRTQGG